jgi:hypothetical protein
VQGNSSDLEQISLNMTNRQKYTVDGIHFFSTQQVTLVSMHRQLIAYLRTRICG